MLLLCITGPTASGKTRLAIEVCKRINGEIISADSMQIYIGMDILTAKPSQAEMAEVRHHLVGILPMNERCTASKYAELAEKAIDEVLAKRKVPVVCGGTGLYIDALTKPLTFGGDVDEEYRRTLKEIAETEEGRIRLHNQLLLVDPEKANKLHYNDSRRVIRALEIHHQLNETATEREQADSDSQSLYDGLLFNIEWPRDVLYKRINERVDQMIRDGLVNEVQELYKHESEYPTAAQAIGYKEITAAFRGDCTLNEAIEQIKTGTRHYAKRQLTWFRRDERVSYLNAQALTFSEMAERIISDYLEASK